MMEEVFPNRQSIRKTGWDYTSAGYYFVTINTRKGRSLFGAVVNGRMVLNEAIISGFLSPMERAVFTAGLKHRRPLIWVKPFGGGDLSTQTRAALDEGRLLVVLPFAEGGWNSKPVRRAAWCNQYVLAHCDRMVIGNLNPGGMLSCILSESDPDKEIVYL